MMKAGTNFKYFQNMSIDELAEWLDIHCLVDSSPWMHSFNEKYCSKCESIKCKYVDAEEKLGITPFSRSGEIECAYCELENKCKFFPELDDVPDNKETIKIWLEEEAE